MQGIGIEKKFYAFAQADSIVPPGVQGLDRYAYVNNSPLNYVDPSGHNPWFIAGWDPNYIQKQDGNTCAVVSTAVAISILYGQKLTQQDIQVFFPNTYAGIGVIPAQQEAVINNFAPEIQATYSTGNKTDLIQNLNNDKPTLVTINLNWDKSVGHVILAIGFDPATGEIMFFDPAYGDVVPESTILDRYNQNRGFTSFDDLWAENNEIPLSLAGQMPGNSMVTVEFAPENLSIPSTNNIVGGGGGGGFTPRALLQ